VEAYQPLILASIMLDMRSIEYSQSASMLALYRKADAHLKQVDRLRLGSDKGYHIELLSFHQHYCKTLARETGCFTALDDASRLPARHIAFRLEQGVQALESLLEIASTDDRVIILDCGIRHSSGDASSSLKFAVDSSLPGLGGHIIEFVCYPS